jgi:Hexameric tyrosine-coordinated heme protein (HTHP)
MLPHFNRSATLKSRYIHDSIFTNKKSFNMDTIKLIPTGSLIVATPEEGRQLAVKMARLVIKLTQPDEEKRKEQREIYANDPAMLIQIGQTVAIEFATIAAANNYWR